MRRVEEVTKANDAAFVDVHPSQSRQTTLHGRNLPPRNGCDGNEGKYQRCRQCGFILDVSKTSRGSGWGNEQAVLKSGETAIYNDVNVMAGCPLCGSSEF